MLGAVSRRFSHIWLLSRCFLGKTDASYEYFSERLGHSGIMKNILTFSLMGALAVSSVSCTTSYDAYGNPRQSIDPGTAAVGVAAAGVLGYAIAKNRSDKRNRYHNQQYSHNYHGNRRYDQRRGYYDRRGSWRPY